MEKKQVWTISKETGLKSQMFSPKVKVKLSTAPPQVSSGVLLGASHLEEDGSGLQTVHELEDNEETLGQEDQEKVTVPDAVSKPKRKFASLTAYLPNKQV